MLHILHFIECNSACQSPLFNAEMIQIVVVVETLKRVFDVAEIVAGSVLQTPLARFSNGYMYIEVHPLISTNHMGLILIEIILFFEWISKIKLTSFVNPCVCHGTMGLPDLGFICIHFEAVFKKHQ